MTVGAGTLMEQEETEREAGAKRDLHLVRLQADLVVEQLRGEGREIAADIVDGLDTYVSRLSRDLEEVREELAELKAGAKTSRGKDRASAAGTISADGKARHGFVGAPSYVAGGIAPPHKHEYSGDGKCIKVTQGITCTATRQRQRKPKQTLIPGTDGAKGAETSS